MKSKRGERSFEHREGAARLRFARARKVFAPPLAFAFLLLCLSPSAHAEVDVTLKNGSHLKFESVTIQGSKLEGRLKEGVITLSPEQLCPTDAAKYFGDPGASLKTNAARVPEAAVPPPDAGPEPAPYRPAPTRPAIGPRHTGGFLWFFEKPPAAGRLRPGEGPLDLPNQNYYLYVPKDYTGQESYGLVVLIPSGDMPEVPWGWETILEQKKMLFVTPHDAGDQKTSERRTQLALAGLLKMMEEYNVDPKRVYVAGSGSGARLAIHLAFQRPDVIRGCVAASEVDFYKSVKFGGRISGWPIHPSALQQARQSVRFSLIAGEADPYRDEVVDTYYGGFQKESFTSKLFQVPSSPQGLLSP
ncbi:MAG: hypothetical protein JO317_02130, partial [Verrucomicrobiae bacterium]|nr:hypothetical protein [Verrucomicrobiae bacterium]